MVKAPSSRTPAAASASGQKALPLLFLFFLLMGAAMLYFFTLRPLFRGMAARQWVETPCRIVSSTVKEISGSDSITYRPEIVFSYEVAGRRYQSSRYQLIEFSSSGRKAKAEVVARYPRGKTAVCYVNPKDPADAVLDRDPIPSGLWALFPLPFAAVGAVGLVWALRNRSKTRAVEAATAAGEPWRARADWAAGRIVSSNNGTLGFTWLFAALWNAISTPIAWVALRNEGLRWPAAMVLFFPLVGMLLLLGAIYVTMRWLRFGESALEMAAMPVVPGGAVMGIVHLNRPIRPDGPVRLRLNCFARETRKTSDGTSTSERLVWQREEYADISPAGDSFPVAVPLPADAAVTSAWSGGNGIFWRLEAAASLPGVDYKAQFEIPVCAGEIAPETAAAVRAVQAREQAETAAYVPAASRVRIAQPLRGGTEFYSPPGRSPLGTLIVGGILAGVLAGIRFAWASREWGLVFGLGVGAFIVGFILTYIWTSSVRTHIGGGLVTVTQKFAGIPTVRTFAAADVVEIRPDITANTGSTLTYGLKIVCRDGKTETAADRIPSEREAQWVAARMMEAIRKP